MLLFFATMVALSAATPDASEINLHAQGRFHVDQNNSICQTPACVHSASFILSNMDPSVSPCENFYQFACGKFVEETVIPDNEDKVGTFSISANKLQEQLRIKVSDVIKEDDQPVIKKMKSYYQTCMDTDQIDKSSENDLREIMKNLGGCPVLEGLAWNETNFEWKKSVYEGNKIGYSTDIFVRVVVTNDPHNKTKNMIHLGQASMELPPEYYLNGTDVDYVKVYLNAVTGIAVVLGADRIQAEKEFSDSMKFEIELAKISALDEELDSNFELNKRMSVHDLEANFTGIPWTQYLNEILSPHARVFETDEVVVTVPSYFKRLPGLIERTPKRVLANYACVRAISKSVDYMGKKFLAVITEANKDLISAPEQPPRWKDCLGLVSKHFYAAIGWLYVKNYFDRDAKMDAVHLTENLRNSLYQLIRKADWMDKSTQLSALEKLHFLAAHIGYPDELENVELINEVFQKLILYPRSFLRSQMNLEQLSYKIMYSQLRKPADALQWLRFSRVAVVNAFYYPDQNSFNLPAGILQGHFYNKDRPKYVNYGATGQTIGHELSHAFDYSGRNYDKDGNLVNWWKNETKQEYFIKAKCFTEQYNNYTVKEVNMAINGTKTRNENIADNLGLKAAYIAYGEWAKNNSKEPRLPGLHYTPQQMFWISYASAECIKMRPARLISDIKNNPHSYAEFRVIGSVSNSYEFSKDFECPLGSPMNPVKKCSIY